MFSVAVQNAAMLRAVSCFRRGIEFSLSLWNVKNLFHISFIYQSKPRLNVNYVLYVGLQFYLNPIDTRESPLSS